MLIIQNSDDDRFQCNFVFIHEIKSHIQIDLMIKKIDNLNKNQGIFLCYQK